MKRILLVEPAYKNKFPPLGLMKIATFHKMEGDQVVFTKGALPDTPIAREWDRVYVSTLFTFEWEETREAILYALSVVKNTTNVFVGGIMATLMPELIKATFPTVQVVTGLLNRDGTLGFRNEHIIDTLPPDYAILNHTGYVYPMRDYYLTYTTRGCGMKCQFCAVQTLEPEYIPYVDIKNYIRSITNAHGEKRHLILMDNNVLKSPQFDRIIDDLISLGFGKNATYINPLTKKPCKRTVDFNQGLDANFLDEHKAKRLGEIALQPVRIAFDHIEDTEKYTKAVELCVKHGNTYISNYLLYNVDSLVGKGKLYPADTPLDLYRRMKINIDLKDTLSQKYRRIDIFSFPMKYIPLNATHRGFLGTNWKQEHIRAVQLMLFPTMGKGVASRSFFNAAFGATEEEFLQNLEMPSALLQARGYFKLRKNETLQDAECRYEKWAQNQQTINRWKDNYKGVTL